MHYGEIKNCDIANGEGVRVTLFVSGCTNHCKNCFQPQTWDFDYGQPFTSETEQQLFKTCWPLLHSGTDPTGRRAFFEPENQRVLVPFVRRVGKPTRKRPCGPSPGSHWRSCGPRAAIPAARRRTSCCPCWTCWDGRFVEAFEGHLLRFRGSSNQRLIDMKKHWHQARSSCCRIWTGNPVKHKEESSHHGNYGTEDRITSDGKRASAAPRWRRRWDCPACPSKKFETGRQTPSQEQQQKLAGLRRVPPLSPGRDRRSHQYGQLAQRCRPQEDVVLPKAVRKATAAVVAQSGDNGRSDGAVFSALLKSDSFKALVRETVLTS